MKYLLHNSSLYNQNTDKIFSIFINELLNSHGFLMRLSNSLDS